MSINSNVYMNLYGTKVAKTGRIIGFGALSLITGLYCAELCTAALLHVMGAVSLGRLASSTTFIVGVAAASLTWALWRMCRMQRACDDRNCPSMRSMWLISVFSIAVFVVDVVL